MMTYDDVTLIAVFVVVYVSSYTEYLDHLTIHTSLSCKLTV